MSERRHLGFAVAIFLLRDGIRIRLTLSGYGLTRLSVTGPLGRGRD
jgi:hypothetical protein